VTLAVLLGIVTGLALAGIYVLIALSFTLVLAASGVFNFAQGSIVMGGTLAAWTLGVHLGIPKLLVLVISMGLGLVAGALTYGIAVLPALGRTKNFTEVTLLSTIGLGGAANAFAALLFGADPKIVPSYVTEKPIFIGSLPLRPIYLVMIGVALLLALLLELIIRRTSLGHVFRATLEDGEGALLLGINTRTVVWASFALGGLLAAAAGFLIAPVSSASAFNAQGLAFFGFAGMAIGGFGSFRGALVGGGIIGLVGGLAPVFWTPDATLPLTWLAVVVILIIAPSGIWGGSGLFGARLAREV
jgi:branched-chain amino acid transport system permease protein